MVPCPFSRLSEKQLRGCGVLRKEVTAGRNSFLRTAEIWNVADQAMGKRQVVPNN
jgi:hypothetical protein